MWRARSMAAASGFAAQLVTLFAHMTWVFGIKYGYLEGGFIPITPSLPVTPFALLLQSLGGAVLYAPLLFLAAPIVMHRTWGLAAMGGCYVLLWLIGASIATGEYQIDFGTTWGSFDAFRALFFQPVMTPALLLSGLAGHLLHLRRLFPSPTHVS